MHYIASDDNRILPQILGVPHAAVLSVVFGLFLISFPMGAFVIFTTEIGGEINHDLPLTHLAIFEETDLYLVHIPVTVGDAFVVLWVFYLIIFAIAFLGPAKGFGGTITDVLSGLYLKQHGMITPNYMFGAIMWFSILVLFSILITILQDSVGIHTIPPVHENRLVEFFYITLAPILEETGFRLLLVGIPVFLIYASRFSPRYFAASLWRPAAHLNILHDSKKALVIVVLVGAMFGFSHIALGEPWSEGKFAQATASGIILGWVYIRYGFVASLIIHWAANYFVFAHAHFISQTHLISIEDAFSHMMIISIEVILVVCGILSIILLIASHRYRNTQNI